MTSPEVAALALSARHEARLLAAAFASQAQAQVPACVITGFLGSGKSTLVAHILRNRGSLRMAVLVNEVSRVAASLKDPMLYQCQPYFTGERDDPCLLGRTWHASSALWPKLCPLHLPPLACLCELLVFLPCCLLACLLLSVSVSLLVSVISVLPAAVCCPVYNATQHTAGAVRPPHRPDACWLQVGAIDIDSELIGASELHASTGLPSHLDLSGVLGF